MGLVFALVFSGFVLGALYFTGKCSRQALEIVGALLICGIAGYAWQGSPDMAGHPVTHSARVG